jgi:hypothetical protein
MGKRFDT